MSFLKSDTHRCCSGSNMWNGIGSTPHSSSDQPFLESGDTPKWQSFPVASLARVNPQREAPRSNTAPRNMRQDDEEIVRQGEDPDGKQHISCAYYLEDVKGFKEISSKKATRTF